MGVRGREKKDRAVKKRPLTQRTTKQALSVSHFFFFFLGDPIPLLFLVRSLSAFKTDVSGHCSFTINFAQQPAIFAFFFSLSHVSLFAVQPHLAPMKYWNGLLVPYSFLKKTVLISIRDLNSHCELIFRCCCPDFESSSSALLYSIGSNFLNVRSPFSRIMERREGE